MDTHVHYQFRGIIREANVYFSFEKQPYFLFILLKEADVISEFGEDITIQTDLEQSLIRKDSYPALTHLRSALFAAVKETQAFQMQKAALQPGC